MLAFKIIFLYICRLMKKLVVRFFLSLCILLLSGYGQLYAHACMDHSSTELDANVGTAQESLAWIKKSTNKPGREKRFFKIYHATEVEEEEDGESESVTLKRNSGGSNYFAAIFSNQTPDYFFGHINEVLPFCKYFSHISYRRHLILQVFRI